MFFRALALLGVASQSALLEQLRTTAGSGALELGQSAALFSANPANFYCLTGKVRVAAGADADLMLLDCALELVHVLARDKRAVSARTVVLSGTFASPD